MIRRAVETDKMRVLRLARDFHAASGTALPFSAPMTDALFRASIVEDDRLCLVLDVDGLARGVLAAQAGTHNFSPVRVATEIMWWVDPEARGGAAKMLPAYEAWAKERGCAFAAMVGLGADPAVGRLYERSGYAPAERHFLKRL